MSALQFPVPPTWLVRVVYESGVIKVLPFSCERSARSFYDRLDSEGNEVVHLELIRSLGWDIVAEVGERVCSCPALRSM